MLRNFLTFWLALCITSPGACELICTNHIISSIDEIMKKHLYSGVRLPGDFNNLNDTQLRSYPLKQVFRMATRRSAILDKIFTKHT